MHTLLTANASCMMHTFRAGFGRPHVSGLCRLAPAKVMQARAHQARMSRHRCVQARGTSVPAAARPRFAKHGLVSPPPSPHPLTSVTPPAADPPASTPAPKVAEVELG